jgi:hypothetical protein
MAVVSTEDSEVAVFGRQMFGGCARPSSIPQDETLRVDFRGVAPVLPYLRMNGDGVFVLRGAWTVSRVPLMGPADTFAASS